MKSYSPGSRLGSYEVLGHVGAGGMGDVYRARDTRLDRTVALKISKEQFTPRFETEARATAALEHPHICRLYDICHEEGTSFLVMEYVEGTPLAGPLPLEQVLTYAGQIASALDEAHRKQIVHRDLKPSNVLVTPKGGVKLLDFGLAKLGSRDAPLDDAALTRGITAAGTILGTLHYMSPEQLQGSPADARSDIFAFGLVLYEMLTGKRAFDGASAASIIAAILERPAPSVTEIAPSSLDRLIKRCLTKDPDERWQSARDIRAALDLIVEPSISAPVAVATTSTSRSRLWPWLVAGAFATGLAALSFVHFREAEPTRSLVRFQIPIPEGTRVTAPVVSPDGRSVAFVATARNGVSQIWIRQLDTLDMRPVPGSENAAANIFWSPDNRSLAFVSDRQLRTIAYTSNETSEYEIYVAPYPRSAQGERISTNGGTQPRWRRDGKELYYISPDLKLMAVPVTRNGQKLEFGTPTELFQTRISLGGTLAYRMLRYDVTRDGQRFLINSEPEGAPPPSPSITVVLNWTKMLEK